MPREQLPKVEALIVEHINTIYSINSQVIEHIANLITEAFKKGKTLILFGNGGSAADAQHIAAEFVGQDALPAIALTANSSIVTAIANDYGYPHVFARQVEALVKEGDVVIGISTSGRSENVNLGIEKAKELHAITIGLTGREGGTLIEIAEHCITVPSGNTQRIQEAHIFILHIIWQLVEEKTKK